MGPLDQIHRQMQLFQLFSLSGETGKDKVSANFPEQNLNAQVARLTDARALSTQVDLTHLILMKSVIHTVFLMLCESSENRLLVVIFRKVPTMWRFEGYI